MKEITVAVIGSGSTYCPELVDGFLKCKDLKLKKITFMDIDDRKRNIVGGLCVRMLEYAGVDCEVKLTDDLDEALVGADFVVTQIRVGKLPARYLDETIPPKYNLIGQETTGIGGFFKALRTIPVMKNIAEKIEKICPDAWLINFTNPSGIITEYMVNHTNVKCIGLCNVPIDMIDDTTENAGAPVDITYLGLNHLSWINSVKKDGKEILPDMINGGFSVKVMKNIQDDGFSLDCLRAIQGIPSSYLQYYYCRNAKLEHCKSSDKCRAAVCMEIEEQLLEMYQNQEIHEKPALLDERGGHKYSLVAVSLIDAIANDKQNVQIVNTRNNGVIPFLEDNDIVEVACVIGKDGAKPVPITVPINDHMKGLITVVKQYERYAVEAAMTGSDDAAMNALTVHPLVGDYENGKACYEEMKEAHKEFLPQFFN